MFAKKIGLDLGTCNMRVYVRGEGIVADEPSVAATDRGSGRLLAVGAQAVELAEQAPRSIALVRPVREGTIVDQRLAERVLAHLVTRAQGRQRLFRPEVMICVPASATGDDRRAMTEAAMVAGARQAWLIETPLAAAMGIGLPVADEAGHAICDLGGGATQVAVVSMSGVTVAQVAPVGGGHLDAAIAAAVRDRHGVEVDEPAAEALKLAIGSAPPLGDVVTAQVAVRGGGSATVTSAELTDAIQEPLDTIAATVRQVLDQTPARMAAGVVERGLHLVGGGALLRNIDQYLARETGVAVRVADQPRTCAVRGTRRALGEFEVVQRRQLYLR